LLRIRLSRVGKRKQPYYRLVVTESRNPRAGSHVEIVGHINPLTEPATITLKEERLIHWLQVGAQPSDTAAKLLTKAGVMEKAGKAPIVYEGKEVPPGKRGKKGEAAEAEASAAPAPAAVPAPADEATAEPAPEESAESAPEESAESAPEETAAEPAAEEPSTEEADAPAEEPAAEPAEDAPESSS
jgi:small subunit ribosomal protein S16